MYNGKALYNPQGRSGEYAKWAINFYNGCTGGCEYCYNKRFPLLSGTVPQLKASFKDKTGVPTDIVAQKTVTKELLDHRDEIVREGGVFLSFVSDPCLPETISLTRFVIECCSAPFQVEVLKEKMGLSFTEIIEQAHKNGAQDPGIPIIILTKQADWILKADLPQYKSLNDFLFQDHCGFNKHVAFGFTLTGHDEMEPGCSSNADRIKAMKILHDKGYLTWASIEPIIDFRSSLEMIRACAPFCDHFKIGVRTDRKFSCTEKEIIGFINAIRRIAVDNGNTVYFKQSFRDLYNGEYLYGSKFVEEGYNMFTKTESKKFVKYDASRI